MDTLEDGQLVDGYRETGEIRFFDELVRRHTGRVRGMVYPMVLNHADTDEVTQEVLLRVVRSIDRFRQQASFTSWLHRITMNTTYSFLKSRSRRPIAPSSEPPEQEAPHADPSQRLAFAEEDDRVTQALASLSPKLRAAITLTAIQGMSVKDAAKTMGCPTATVYWRVHEARKVLKRKLNMQEGT